jgi:hypothetical protein
MEGAMSQRRAFVDINISSIPVEGWGGLGLLGVAAVTAVTLPELRLPVLFGIGGGAVLAMILVAFRRVTNSSRPAGEPPSVLFRSEAERERFGSQDRDRDANRRVELPARLVVG